MRALISSLLALVALPLSACPQPDDMKRGVLFRLDDGGIEMHRVLDKDWVRVRARFAEGDEGELDYYHGIYLASDTPIENGKPQPSKRETFGSKANLRKWSKPQPQARWRNQTADGGRASSGTLKTVKVGACRFDAFEVTIDFAAEKYREVYLYLQAFGTALLIESDDGKTKERYRYTAAGVMP